MAEQNPEQPAEQQRAASNVHDVWVRWRLRALIVVVALFGLGPVIWFGAEAVITRGRTTANLTLAGHDVSRALPQDVQRAISAADRELGSRKLSVLVDRKRFELEPRAIAFRLDRPETLERALGAGRQGNVLRRFGGFVARMFKTQAIAPKPLVDREALARLLEEWQDEAIGDRPTEGGVAVEDLTPRAIYPKAGRGVPPDEARRLLLEALVTPGTTEVRLPVTIQPASLPRSAVDDAVTRARALLAGSIELSLDAERKLSVSTQALAKALATRREGERLALSLDPGSLKETLEAERKAIESEPVEAEFEVDAHGKVSITESAPGLRVDFQRLPEVLLGALASRKGPLLVKREPEPKLSTEEAKKLGIAGLVSSFTTRHACCQKRVENIHHIADLLDGMVVRPGETVSLNEVVGPRTLKNGFVPAPTIEEGEFVDTPGGGISQFATTMFNALFHGGYDIVERQPHTYWFPRYPEGHEATLSWPKPDLIFKNDTEAGLLIKTAYTGTSITVRLYGNNGGRKVKALVAPRTDITQPPMELLANRDLEPNREKRTASGAIGWSIVVGRLLTFPDGTTREEKRKVTYRPKSRVIEVHPCRIPKGEKGYTGERCPEPKDAEIVEPEDKEQEDSDEAH